MPLVHHARDRVIERKMPGQALRTARGPFAALATLFADPHLEDALRCHGPNRRDEEESR
jgi:hypothetical protein